MMTMAWLDCYSTEYDEKHSLLEHWFVVVEHEVSQ